MCDRKVWENGIILSLRSRTSFHEIWLCHGLLRSRLQNSPFLCILSLVKWRQRYLWYFSCLFWHVPFLTMWFSLEATNINVIETKQLKIQTKYSTRFFPLSPPSRFLECGIYRLFHHCRSFMKIMGLQKRWIPFPWYLTMIMACFSQVCFCSCESTPLLLESCYHYD